MTAIGARGRLVISTEVQTARPGERLLAEEVACFAGSTLAELGGEMELLVRRWPSPKSVFPRVTLSLKASQAVLKKKQPSSAFFEKIQG